MLQIYWKKQKIKEVVKQVKWNVYRYNINKRKIEVWNVFDHGSFKEEVDNLLTKELTREEFEKELKS